ncbi:MAG: hypothetical protein MRJ93_03300 [Nitrososphaeraceae archaeon]|nr:hypothetical protein [Nitrososphaeraceae archaeon]
MKSEFIVSKIEASQDESSPFVYIIFSNFNTRNRNQPQSPFGNMGTAFSSPEDLMKNLSKLLGGAGGIGGMGSGDTPAFKLSIREYNESGLKVGDKVTIEITKSNSNGI